MTINFEIEEHYAFRQDGRLIDVHNCFDFEGYHYRTDIRELSITFMKSDGDWIKDHEYSKLVLIHTNVSFLLSSYNNKDYEYPHDDKCLSDVTFFPSSERETNDSVTLQSTPNEDDDILYIFQSEHFIRVHCEKIELVTYKD